PAQQVSAQQIESPGSASPRHATLRELPFYSPALDRDMQYLVYLPPNYEADRRRYPVLFLLPGDGGSSRDWVGHGLTATADQMIASREVQPMIIVMPEDDVG